MARRSYGLKILWQDEDEGIVAWLVSKLGSFQMDARFGMLDLNAHSRFAQLTGSATGSATGPEYHHAVCPSPLDPCCLLQTLGT